MPAARHPAIGIFYHLHEERQRPPLHKLPFCASLALYSGFNYGNAIGRTKCR
jgi:hypothetical protein